MTWQDLKNKLAALQQRTSRWVLIASLVTLAALIIGIDIGIHSGSSPATPPSTSPSSSSSPPEPSAATYNTPGPSTFSYTFNTSGTLYEAGNATGSTSAYWWVDSGAELIIANGIGSTIQGSLPAGNSWRTIYATNNPQDTDDGLHPQNIFRLVTQYVWTDYTEQAYFKINANELSASPNRSVSNGLLLFNRYQDAFNLYYAGIRVDGTAVSKKKIKGTYYTMAQNTIFPGTYNAVTSPNLLPEGVWIGLKTEVSTLADGTVSIKLYMDMGRTGNWILVAQATDDGTLYGGPPIAGPAHLGIRTDFMDVQFSDYEVTAM